MTWPLMILMRSPGTPTTRLMKLTFDSCLVGREQAWSVGLGAPHSLRSAPTGGWETRMSPTSGLEKREPMRVTRTRWPTASVGSIDSLGMRDGFTRERRVAGAGADPAAVITTT